MIVSEHWYDFRNIDIRISAGLLTTIAAASLVYLLIFPRKVITASQYLNNFGGF